MMIKVKNIAIILAGGVGSRMGLGYPKQFSKIAGKTALEHTISVFQDHEDIDEIIIASEKESFDRISNLVGKGNFNKVVKIVYGGKQRTDSTLSAISSLSNESSETRVLIHDAVRPLIGKGVISNCLRKLEKYNAVDVAIPATDTILHVDTQTKEILNIPKRSDYYQGQTPQGFKLGVLRDAYYIYENSDIEATCDCGIVLKTLPHEKVAIVEGAHTNIKLTRPMDLFIADKLFQSRSNFSLRNVNSADRLSQLKDKVLVVVGGSYGIGQEIINIANKISMKTYCLSRSNGVNVADIDMLKTAFSDIYEREGCIDYVVNSAAILQHKPLMSMQYDEIIEGIQVNYIGVVNVALAAYPYLKEVHGGFLNFTSSSYTRGRPFYSIYSSTKSAIVNLTQALSEEWAHDNIKINCINPERTKTPMRTRAFGVEPDDTLLSSKTVALASILTLASQETGNIIDVTLKDESHVSKLFNDLNLL